MSQNEKLRLWRAFDYAVAEGNPVKTLQYRHEAVEILHRDGTSMRVPLQAKVAERAIEYWLSWKKAREIVVAVPQIILSRLTASTRPDKIHL